MDNQMIYELLNGFIDLERVSLPIDFPIEQIIDTEKNSEHILVNIYEAKKHLCEKLGSEEDLDLEQIMDGMNELCKIIAYEMYHLGKQQGMKYK